MPAAQGDNPWLELDPSYETERDIDQDRSDFFEATAVDRVEELTVEADRHASTSLESEIDESRLLILGETHGVKENADIIYTLFKQFDFRNLALEWDVRLQETVEEFLDGRELDFDTIEDSPDGRITAEHFSLLKKLQQEGLIDKLICFDEASQSDRWDARDENMANNITSNLPENGRTLVVTGKLHAETGPIVLSDEEGPQHPMGELITQQIPSAPSCKINYLSGQFHNFGTKNFQSELGPSEHSKARLYKSEGGVYHFELPQAHSATVPDPSRTL